MPDDVKEALTDLPMSQLIGAPLQAVCKAQVQLANASWEFIKTIAFEDQEGKKTRLLQFDLERPVETASGTIEKNAITVQAPFLGLVPIPALLIDDVTVDFQMEVTSQASEKSTTAAEVSTKIGYNSWWGLNAEINGKVTTSRENTRSTNQTAKYQVHVIARQQPPTEGLHRLMDIMATCTAPLSVKKGS